MGCEKRKFRTEREALDQLRRLRRSHRGKDVRTLTAYFCTNGCEAFHIGHAWKTSRQAFPKVSNGEWRKMKARVEDLGRKIAADELRVAKHKVAELAPVVAQDREWLKRMADAAEFHQACADALRTLVDAHFAGRLA